MHGALSRLIRLVAPRRPALAVALLTCAAWHGGAAQVRQAPHTPGAPAVQTAPRSDPTPAKTPVASPADAQPAVKDLPTMVVTGVQPGPGLWRVSNGDHVLYVLGTLSPLPKGIEWDTNAVEKAIAQSQAVLASPSVRLDADVGFFGKLALIPSALRARRNPDGRTLQQLLPPAQYARWQAAKARYIGSDGGIERWRPVFAALELYDHAIRKSGMTQAGVVEPALHRMARRYGVKTVKTEVVVRVAEPKQALRDFAASALDDRVCFDRTLDRIDGDLGTMVARANAWSIGDVDALRRLPYTNQFNACAAAFTSAAFARKYGIANLSQRIESTWLAAARAALATNRSTFATLPISQLLQPDGYLSKLEAEGYRVEPP